jgi:hypothetical protein
MRGEYRGRVYYLTEQMMFASEGFYLLELINHFKKLIASVRFAKVVLFLPCESVKAIEFLFDEIELTGKLTVISCPFKWYDIIILLIFVVSLWVKINLTIKFP